MRSVPPALLASLLGGLVGGCSCSDGPSDAPAGVPLALLERSADAAIEEPGRLEPGPADGWGARALAGWSKASAVDASGLRYVATNQPRAILTLDATDPVDRELALLAWIADPRPDSGGELRLSLNGVEVARLALESEPAEHVLRVPAERWRSGPNELALESAAARGSDPSGADWDVFRVASIRYGERRVVERLEPSDGSARVRLAPGTGLLWCVESPDAFALWVRGEAAGAGRLSLALGTMDPASGAPAIAESGRLERSLAAGPFDLRLPWPPGAEPARPVRVVELTWHAEDERALALAAVDLEEAEARPRPPIFLISIDTLAARHLSLHGYARPTTPALERLAAEAVVFERCRANAPWTLPSYLSLLSGLYPRAHLVELTGREDVELSNFDWWQVAENRWTLAEALRSRGYETAGIVDSHWLSPRFRLAQGFEVYSLEPAEVPFDDPLGGIDLVVRQILGWLDRRTDERPPFVFAHALDCHGPYWPEAPWRDRFAADVEDPSLLPARGSYRTYRAVPMWMSMTVAASLADTASVPERLALEPLIARYDETILEMDAYLERLFAGLRERGLWDEALVIVTADHGESFAHRHYDHGELWEDVLHVPLVVKLPHGVGGGRRVADDVQLVDVFPTILDLLGLDPRRPALHGRSLLPLARGEALEALPAYSTGGFVRQAMVAREGWKLVERFPALESGEGALLTHPLVPEDWLRQHFPELLEQALTDERLAALRARPGFAERVAELRTLLRGPYVELYDLAADPQETRDVAALHPERVAALTALLRREQAREQEARRAAEATPLAGAFDEGALRDLQGLGYGGSDPSTDGSAPESPGRPPR